MLSDQAKEQLEQQMRKATGAGRRRLIDALESGRFSGRSYGYYGVDSSCCALGNLFYDAPSRQAFEQHTSQSYSALALEGECLKIHACDTLENNDLMFDLYTNVLLIAEAIENE